MTYDKITLKNGQTIYRGFNYPETLEGLDLNIVKNTLDEIAKIHHYIAIHQNLK